MIAAWVARLRTLPANGRGLDVAAASLWRFAAYSGLDSVRGRMRSRGARPLFSLYRRKSFEQKWLGRKLRGAPKVQRPFETRHSKGNRSGAILEVAVGEEFNPHAAWFAQ